MNYKARYVYRNEVVVRGYDQKRFLSLKGRFIDRREKNLIFKAIIMTGIAPNSRLLDIPCGTGRLSIFLAEKGFQVVGVDVSQAMIDQARKKLKSAIAGRQVSFITGDAESLSFSDSFFDIVVSLRFFGHLPSKNRENVLKELSRVSKSFVIVAYYHRISVQGFIRKRIRSRKGILWYSVSLKQIDNELKTANLKRVARFFLFFGISETIVVLARKL